MPTSPDTLTVALISDLFFDAGAEARLGQQLARAKQLGAELAMLPELPANAWCPATRDVRDDDAEPPGGRRHTMLSRAAAAAGIGLLGGAIMREASTGGRMRRLNKALLFDGAGKLVLSYAKLHLPEEDGFWETSHYEPGTDPPGVSTAFSLPIGVQLCSDVNRPEGSHLLGALGAEALLCPRATESGSWERWKMVLRANAVTSTAYVLSVNRPRPEGGVPLGGPSLAVAPDGSVLLETTDTVAVVTLRRDVVAAARRAYPGYLPVRAELYARGWQQVRERTSDEK